MTKRVNNKKFLNRCFWNVHGKGKKEKRPRTLIGTNWSLIGKLFHQLGHWLHKHARGRVRHAFLNKLHLKAASQVFNPGGGSPNCGHFGAKSICRCAGHLLHHCRFCSTEGWWSKARKLRARAHCAKQAPYADSRAHGQALKSWCPNHVLRAAVVDLLVRVIFFRIFGWGGGDILFF